MTSICKRIAAVGVLSLGTLAGCGTKTANSEPPKEYKIHGEIKSVDASEHVATIKHDAIPGFMNAMTMGYQVKDPVEFSELKAGETIDGTVYVSGDDMWVGNIKEAQK